MSTSKASSARPPAGRKIFVVSLPPATSQELSPLSESTSLPPVPFERVATNSAEQTEYSGTTGAGSNAGTTSQTTNASNSN